MVKKKGRRGKKLSPSAGIIYFCFLLWWMWTSAGRGRWDVGRLEHLICGKAGTVRSNMISRRRTTHPTIFIWLNRKRRTTDIPTARYFLLFRFSFFYFIICSPNVTSRGGLVGWEKRKRRWQIGSCGHECACRVNLRSFQQACSAWQVETPGLLKRNGKGRNKQIPLRRSRKKIQK